MGENEICAFISNVHVAFPDGEISTIYAKYQTEINEMIKFYVQKCHAYFRKKRKLIKVNRMKKCEIDSQKFLVGHRFKYVFISDPIGLKMVLILSPTAKQKSR